MTLAVLTHRAMLPVDSVKKSKILYTKTHSASGPQS